MISKKKKKTNRKKVAKQTSEPPEFTTLTNVLMEDFLVQVKIENESQHLN